MPLHTALYQTRSAARAVVHLHSTHSVALSMLPEIDPRAALPPMTPYYLMKCGHTALVPYYRPGDPAVADAIKGLAGKYSSVLLANHGPVVSGDTLEAAVFAIEELEETAKLYLLLRGLNPRYLSPEQVEDLTKVFGLTLPEHGHDLPRHGRACPAIHVFATRSKTWMPGTSPGMTEFGASRVAASVATHRSPRNDDGVSLRYTRPTASQSQIRLPHIRIDADVRRTALHQHAPGLQDVGAVGDLEALRPSAARRSARSCPASRMRFTA